MLVNKYTVDVTSNVDNTGTIVVGATNIAYIGRAATITSESVLGYGIQGLGSNQVIIDGAVFAYNKAVMLAAGAASNVVTIHDGGIVTGGIYGIYSESASIVRNNGDVSGVFAVEIGDGQSKIINSGDIYGENSAIRINGALGQLNTIINTGEIIGANFAINGSNSNADDSIVNAGLIHGAINLGAGADVVDTVEGRIVGVVHLGDGSDLYTGGAYRDAVSGDDGNDAIDLAGGNDTYLALSGDDDDQIDGGDGRDTYDASDAGAAVEINLDTGFATGSTIGSDDIANFENITGSNAGDLLTGDVNANLLRGAGGDDVIDGGAGANTLDGGAGNDMMTGGAGNDTFRVDAAGDSAFDTLGGIDRVVSKVTFTLNEGIERMVLQGVSAINGTGNSGANFIVGNIGANSLTGAGGNDTISGNDGADVINGGTGADKMYGGAGNDYYITDDAGDKVSEGSGGGTDSVSSGVTFVLAAGQSIESFGTFGISTVTAINLTGNELAQSVNGNNGNNVLNGGGGNDTIFTGNGTDTIVFNTTPGASNVAKITDFSVVNDTLALDDAKFAALGPTVTADELRIGAAAADGNDFLIYNNATGALSFDSDGNGAGAALQFATLATGLALTSGDFTII
ncbi:hypothetical protein BH10PSE7_BH10PSE7_09500 [soil metagenome]